MKAINIMRERIYISRDRWPAGWIRANRLNDIPAFEKCYESARRDYEKFKTSILDPLYDEMEKVGTWYGIHNNEIMVMSCDKEGYSFNWLDHMEKDPWTRKAMLASDSDILVMMSDLKITESGRAYVENRLKGKYHQIPKNQELLTKRLKIENKFSRRCRHVSLFSVILDDWVNREYEAEGLSSKVKVLQLKINGREYHYIWESKSPLYGIWRRILSPDDKIMQISLD